VKKVWCEPTELPTPRLPEGKAHTVSNLHGGAHEAASGSDKAVAIQENGIRPHEILIPEQVKTGTISRRPF
jgi:hypothetical protein